MLPEQTFFPSTSQNAFARNEINREDTGQVVLYEQRVVAASTDDQGAPAWFEAALQRALAPLQTQLGGLHGKLDDLHGKLDGLHGKLDGLQLEGAKTRAMVAMMANRTAGSDDDATFEIAPFRDGTDPTLPPHNLPALTSPAVIRNLSPAEVDQYYTGYHAGAPPPAGERISLIFSAIGRREG